MSSKKSIGIALGVVAVAAAGAYVGGTAYIGNEVHSTLLAQPRDWARTYPFVEVHELRYEKRFTGATRTTTLKLGCPGSQPTMLTWRDTIHHGPLPGVSMSAAAVIDSEVVLSNETRAKLKQLTGSDAPPLTARTIVNLTGGYTIDLNGAKLSMPMPEGRTLAWHGLTARWKAPATGAVSYEFSTPGFEMSDPNRGAAIKLANVHLRGEGLPLPGLAGLLLGKGSGEMASFDITAPSPTPGANPLTISLRNVKVVGDTGVDARQLFSATSTLSGQAQVGDAKIDKFEMQASMKRMHVQGYEALMTSLLGSSCDDRAMQRDGEALQAALAKILPHNPEYALDRFVVQYAGQQASMSYSASVNGVTEAELRGPLMPVLMAKAAFKFDARVPAAWLEQLPMPSGPDAEPVPAAAMVEGLVQQGALQREGDMLTANVHFAQGTLTVNGRAMQPPASR